MQKQRVLTGRSKCVPPRLSRACLQLGLLGVHSHSLDRWQYGGSCSNLLNKHIIPITLSCTYCDKLELYERPNPHLSQILSFSVVVGAKCSASLDSSTELCAVDVQHCTNSYVRGIWVLKKGAKRHETWCLHRCSGEGCYGLERI